VTYVSIFTGYGHNDKLYINHITIYNKQHHPVNARYNKRYQDPFNEATTNIKDVVNLFFTQKEIRTRSDLRYP
jgi:hypothetical protein